MQKSSRVGFTMIELIVVVAITALIATVSFLTLGRYRSGESVERSSEEIVAAMRAVQQRAITQEEGQAWGIRFVNATSGTPSLGTQSYIVFRGINFTPGSMDRMYTLRSGVRFTDPTASSTKDIVFAPITGKPSTFFSVVVSSPGTPPFTKQIIVATSGAISVQ